MIMGALMNDNDILVILAAIEMRRCVMKYL